MKLTSRKQKMMINTIVSALSEIVSMICGLILPRLILSHYGSSYNGTISSITQMISFVTLLRAGVGGVTRASLYKPLAEGDTEKVSAIVNATERFMRKVALIFVGVAVAGACIYPFIVTDFGWMFTAVLFLTLSASTFIQYYFGITYQLLLMADQRQYIFTAVNILSIVLNTVFSAILINLGCSIIIVKLGSAVAFAITPLVIHFYVRKKYNINRSVPPDTKALEQRWDALGHQIAYYIFTSTDLTVLTFLANVKIVSVYSVYHLPIKAVKTVIKTYSSSAEAAFGNIIAKDQKRTLRSAHEVFECFMFVSCTFLFACTAGLILPFIRIYTNQITDANYYQPVFALLLVAGELTYCLRIPYMTLVESSGQYRQTKRGAYVEATINIVSSVVLCFLIEPLVAVAIGTLLGLLIRTIEISRYTDRNIVNRSRLRFYLNLLASYSVLVIVYIIAGKLPYTNGCSTYVQWAGLALLTAVIVSGVIGVYCIIFYKDTTVEMIKMVKSTILRKKAR